MNRRVKVAASIMFAFLVMIVAMFLIATYYNWDFASPKKKDGSTVKVLVAGGHGSGVHIGNGYILAAAHVTGTSTKEAVIRIKSDGKQIQDAKLLWANSDYDIAMLRVEDWRSLSKAELLCKSLEKGDAIHADGNPGELEFVSTWGRVSGVLRPHDPWTETVVTDITIVQGMSGGPILNDDNQVVGLAVGVMTTNIGLAPSMTGITFIVPSTTVCMLVAKGVA